MLFSRSHFHLILTLTFFLAPCTSTPTPHLPAFPPSSLSAATHSFRAQPSFIVPAPLPLGDSLSPSPLKPAQTSPTLSPSKTRPPLSTDELHIFPSDDLSGAIEQDEDAPGTKGAFLGRSGLESRVFVNHCLMQCEKFSRAERCGTRVTSKPFRTCEYDASLGFESAPTCCFWSRCYNMYGVTNGDTASRKFWREGVKKELCRNQA